MKSILKIMNQPLRAVPKKTTIHTINNKISKILEKHPQRSQPPPKPQTWACSFTGKEPHHRNGPSLAASLEPLAHCRNILPHRMLFRELKRFISFVVWAFQMGTQSLFLKLHFGCVFWSDFLLLLLEML